MFFNTRISLKKYEQAKKIIAQYESENNQSLVDNVVQEYSTLHEAMHTMGRMIQSEMFPTMYCYKKSNNKYVVLPFEIKGVKAEQTLLNFSRVGDHPINPVGSVIP